MGNETVYFDKKQYIPGDIVNAKVIIPPILKKVRKIIISIEIGECTEVERTDSDGDRYTISDKYIHGYTDIVIRPEQFEQEVNITLDLPPYELKPTGYSDGDTKLEIFQRVHIKYDIPFGSDDHSYFPIPTIFPRQIVKTPARTDYNGIVLEVDSNTLYSNPDQPEDNIFVNLIVDNPIKFRQIRLEFLGMMRVKAEGSSDEVKIKSDVFYFDDFRQFPLNLAIPCTRYSTSIGELHEIWFFLKLVFDLPMKSDLNIMLPFMVHGQIQ